MGGRDLGNRDNWAGGKEKGERGEKKDVRVTSCNNSGIRALTGCQCEHFSCFPQTCCASSRNRDVVRDGSGIASSDTLANGLGVGGFQTAAGWGTNGDALWFERLRSVVAKRSFVVGIAITDHVASLGGASGEDEDNVAAGAVFKLAGS